MAHFAHRRPAKIIALAAALLLLVATIVTFAGTQRAQGATSTVVSLTFDDGQASQISTLSPLQAHGMRGTYYINSGFVGSSSYYMTWSQIHDLANAGNEIGGHTVHHTDLTTVNASTAQAEVCDDRTNLTNQGFPPPASFAYPYAAVNATAEQAVQSCGYSSGRGVGSLFSDSCPCPYAETVPPADAYNLRTADGATSSTTLSDLETSVTNAETHGGGWVPLVFHGICDNGCTGSNTVSTSVFAAFLDWLAPRGANGTVVNTVGEVMGGGGQPPPSTPTTTISCNGATCSSGWYRTAPVSVALSATDTSGSGIAKTVYTTDGSDPTNSPSAITYAGPFNVAQTTTVKFSSTNNAGNAEQVKSAPIKIDAAAPAVSLTSPRDGSIYRRGATVSVAASATDAGTGSGAPSGIAGVTFRLDGTTVLATDTSSPYQFTWKTQGHTLIARHTLTAVATDVAQNATTSAPITVTITK